MQILLLELSTDNVQNLFGVSSEPDPEGPSKNKAQFVPGLSSVAPVGGRWCSSSPGRPRACPGPVAPSWPSTP